MSDVFIIGAGCSVPYGFPTGAMLMQKLKNFDYKDRIEYKAQHLLDKQYCFFNSKGFCQEYSPFNDGLDG